VLSPRGSAFLRMGHGLRQRRALNATAFRYSRANIDKVASRSYLQNMRSVGLKVLKNKLSEYVRLVAAGETVLVTDRDRVVAELVPPREGRSVYASDALLADVVRKGWLVPPTMVSSEPPPSLPVAPFAQIVAELDAERSDR
jgi:antitoxin (DNA-binding transcriptional repressor) of toxin-antitoxin stability system